LLYKILRLNPELPEDRNSYHLVVEVFWACILGAAASFNATFALRMGASNEAIGLLSSIPSLLAMLIAIPAGQFLQSLPHAKPWVLGSLFLHRAGFLLIAALPWIKIPGVNPGLLIVIALIIIGAPAHFFNVGFIPLLADVIPESRRAAIFTARNVVNGAMLSLFVFLYGQWLEMEAVPFPGNYQIMYVFGFTAALLSHYFLVKVRVPQRAVAAIPPTQNTFKSQWNALREALRSQPVFGRLTLNTVFHAVGLWCAGPLYIIYYVRTLNASDGWIGLMGTVASLTAILGWMIWRPIVTRYGEPRILRYTIVLLGLIPILVGLLPNLTLILFVIALNGLLAPGINLSHFTILLKVMPADRRPVFTALYTTLVNIGAFICPMIGVVVADWIGLAPALILFGILSIAGSTSFWWRRVLPDQS
jgi:MFS family permease